jgi:hypothetical protein
MAASPEVGARGRAAAEAARQHAARVLQMLDGHHGNECDVGWQQGHAAAQQLLQAYRGAAMRLQQLTAQAQGRERMLHAFAEQQQQQYSCAQQQQQQSRAAPLSAFEAALLCQPALLERRADALRRACELLQQQVQCARAAHVFFAWATSVVQQVSDQQELQGRASWLPGVQLPALNGNMAAPLARQLLPYDTPAAARLLQRVADQLHAAALAAVEAAELAGGGSNGGNTTAAAAAAATAALERVALQQQQQQHRQHKSAAALHVDAAVSSHVTSRFTHAACSALVEHGMLPAPQPELSRLPDDVQQQQQQEEVTQQQQQQEEVTQQVDAGATTGVTVGTDSQLPMRTACPRGKPPTWSRCLVSEDELAKVLQQREAAADFETAATAAAPSAAPLQQQQQQRLQQVAARMPLSAELERLDGLSLGVAKQLSRARTSSQQRLQAAADALQLSDHAAASASSTGRAPGGVAGSGQERTGVPYGGRKLLLYAAR